MSKEDKGINRKRGKQKKKFKKKRTERKNRQKEPQHGFEPPPVGTQTDVLTTRTNRQVENFAFCLVGNPAKKVQVFVHLPPFKKPQFGHPAKRV